MALKAAFDFIGVSLSGPSSLDPNILEMSPDKIVLRSKGISKDVYEIAKKHCLTFGKNKYLISRDLIEKIYTFSCE